MAKYWRNYLVICRVGSKKGILTTELEKTLENLPLSSLAVLSELKNSFMKFNKS